MPNRRQSFKRVEFLRIHVFECAVRVYEAGETASLVDWLATSLIARGIAKAA